MSTKYIINNEDGLITTGQTINGGISATTISADTLIISGSPIPQPSYKVYTALLTQTGTSAPTSIVLENTLGVEVTFSYSLVGQYYLEALGSLTIGKTWVTFNYVNSNGQTVSYLSKSINGFSILTRNSIGITSDNILDSSEIEIRVYD
jgi:hypothetical protein